MEQLMVGAAKYCIDPPMEAYPFPTNFGMTEEKYDECNVRAIAIGNRKRTVVFVVYEMSDIPGVPDLTAKMSTASGVAKEDIILCVTHNHTAPNDRSKFPAPEEKFELFRKIETEQGCKACREAVGSMRPARYGFDTIDSYCNVNRDLKTRFGFWVEGPAYNAYSNKTLAVLKFVDEEDRLIAAMLNYGAHAVCAFVQPDVDGKIKTSGNFPGIACRFVEEHYEGAVVAWTSGAAGNQDPLLFDYIWQEYPDGYVTKLPLPNGSGYLHMEALGRRQGADAVACLEEIREYRTEMPMVYLRTKVSVPARRKKAEFVNMPPFGFRMGGEGLRTDFSAPKLPKLPEFEPDSENEVRYTLNVLRLGHVAVILTSGELYAEIARDMMAVSPVEDCFVITHIPGEGGYTLDKSSADHRTFQSFGNVEPGGADEPLTERTKELVELAFIEDRRKETL